MLELAANDGSIVKSGSWYAYIDVNIGQGRENAKNYLRENPDIFEEVEQKVRAKYNIGADGVIPDATEEVFGEEETEEENN